MMKYFKEMGFMSVENIQKMADEEADQKFAEFKKTWREKKEAMQRMKKGKKGNSKFDDHFVDYPETKLTQEDHEEYYMRGRKSKFEGQRINKEAYRDERHHERQERETFRFEIIGGAILFAGFGFILYYTCLRQKSARGRGANQGRISYRDVTQDTQIGL